MGKYKHGLCKTRLYRIWAKMRDRCEKRYNEKTYQYYKGKGITVCQEWNTDFMSFYNWANENGYQDHLTIDRINNNGNYEPLNCRWATHAEQNRNYSKNVIIEHNGERLTAQDWSLRLGLRKELVSKRIRSGWGAIEAVTTPILSDGYTRENKTFR